MPYQDPAEQRRRERSLLLRAVRAAFFILLITSASLAMLRSQVSGAPDAVALQWGWYVFVAVLLAMLAIAVDVFTPNKRVSSVLGILVGVIAGLLATLALGFIVDLVLLSWVDTPAIKLLAPVVNTFKVLVGITLCYLGAATVLQTKEDFRVIIPYIEFQRQVRGPRPMLIDTSALIDARVADVAASGLLQSPLLVPAFVIAELQALSDSQDGLKRAKGRRGLDIVARMQRMSNVSLSIDDTEAAGASNAPGLGVDQRLVELARKMSGVIVTTDSGLAKVASIQRVSVVNIHDVAAAVKASFVPGEEITVRIVKPGEQAGQGVGFLADGTMVVVEDGGAHLGKTMGLVVTSSLQTSAGRLIFARTKVEAGAEIAPAENGAAAGNAITSGGANGAATNGVGASAVLHAASDAVVSAEPVGQINDAGVSNTGAAGVAGTPGVPGAGGAQGAGRSPFPPHPPRSLRGGSPRNPRR